MKNQNYWKGDKSNKAYHQGKLYKFFEELCVFVDEIDLLLFRRVGEALTGGPGLILLDEFGLEVVIFFNHLLNNEV